MQSNQMYKSTHSLATIMPSLIDEILIDQNDNSIISPTTRK